MFEGTCAVCRFQLYGTIVASRNSFCPEAGHWIHERCQGVFKGSLVSVCSTCKRLGAGYLTACATGLRPTATNRFADASATSDQRIQDGSKMCTSRATQTCPELSKVVTAGVPNTVKPELTRLERNTINDWDYFASPSDNSASFRNPHMSPHTDNTKFCDLTDNLDKPVASFTSITQIPTELLKCAQSFIEYKFDDGMQYSDTVTYEQKQAYPHIKDALSSAKYGSVFSADFPTHNFPIDITAQGLLPPDIRDAFIPVKIPADGSCLYNAVSFCLFKNCDASFLLRRLQHAELYENKERYVHIYQQMNMDNELQKLLRQSASFHEWGTSDSIQILSRVLSRKIYVYRNGPGYIGWDFFDLEPNISSHLQPIVLMNQDNIHYVSLIPNSPKSLSDLPEARCWFTFSRGYIPLDPKKSGKCNSNEAINLEEDTTESNATTAHNEIPIGGCENQTCVVPETGKWDPDIGNKFGLETCCASLSNNDILFLNVLRDEILDASHGPWEANLRIFSKRTSHDALWRTKIVLFFPKYSKENQGKKLSAVKNFCLNPSKFSILKSALKCFGVPLSLVNSYTQEIRMKHIASFMHDTAKTSMPTYIVCNTYSSATQKNVGATSTPTENLQIPSTDEAIGEKQVHATDFQKSIIELASSLGIDDHILQYIPPRSFKFTIPSADQHLLFDTSSGTFCKGYPIVIDKYLNLEQKCCAFKSDHVPYMCKGTSGFANIRGECGCGIKFHVAIKEKPLPGRDVTCSVKTTGDFVLIQENPVGRPLNGYARDLAAKELQHMKPTKVHLERLRLTNKYRALHNNYPQMSSSVLKLIAAEVRNAGSLNQDPFDDIYAFNQEIITNRPRKFVRGFVQKLDRIPDHVNVLMYTQDTLDLLHFLQKSEEVILHLDATGSVVTQKAITKKKCLLYVFLAKSKQFSFPIAEALSQRGTTIEISEMLRRLKYDTKQIYTNARRMVGIAVCDFSFALIHGLMEGLNSMCLEDYLNYSFRLLNSDKCFNPERVVVFICTAHLIHAFSRLLSKHVNKDLHYIAKCSLAKLQECCTLESFASTTRLITRLFDSEYLDENEGLDLYKSLTTHTFDLDATDLSENIQNIMDEAEYNASSTLRSKSPYYHLFKTVRYEVRQIESSSRSKNQYFCQKIVQLLQDNYAPYTPLFATMLLQKSKRHDECRITNAPVESEFNVIKNILHDNGKEPINVFVREDFKYHDGKVARVLETAMMQNKNKQKRKNKGPSSNEHIEVKQSRKDDTKNHSPKCDSNNADTSVLDDKTSKNHCMKTSSFTVKERWSRKPKRYDSPKYFSEEKKLSSRRFMQQLSQSTKKIATEPGTPTSNIMEKNIPKDKSVSDDKAHIKPVRSKLFDERKYDNHKHITHKDELHSTVSTNSGSKTTHGIKNLGYTCYLNSLLQALLAVPAIRQNENESVLKEVYQMLYVNAHPPSEDTIRSMVKYWVSQYSMVLPEDEQQDSHEIFMDMVAKKPFGLEHLFYFLKEKTVSCQCGASKSDYEDAVFHQITQRDDSTSILKLGNVVDELVEATCDLCGSKQKTIKEEIVTAPQVLLVMDGLFSNGTTGKVSKHLRRTSVDNNVVLKTVLGLRNYKLVSVIAHIGSTIRSGHYVAYSCVDGKWIKYDDSRVSTLETEPTFKSEDIYLSFYAKTE